MIRLNIVSPLSTDHKIGAEHMPSRESLLQLDARHLEERNTLQTAYTAALLEVEEQYDAKMKEQRTMQGREREECLALLGEIDGRPCGECGARCGCSCETDYYLCPLCKQRFCDIHRDDTCVECEATYCARCLEDMPKCHACYVYAEELRCCELVEMECGKFEHIGECAYQHCNACECERYER
ncbi:hypothetical protein KIPB_014403 [Kipferlia bialata]|uniref:Uncharacterized protein n=1 Tax=Kipferlia bialata TaxID=797122 RepID=A0A391P2N8_9EUKA|nr:hypothetical protein KIPB_014403 [Kipferlia bialata]|eukprot:g14403.t1